MIILYGLAQAFSEDMSSLRLSTATTALLSQCSERQGEGLPVRYIQMSLWP
jgi:hypothetical protein